MGEYELCVYMNYGWYDLSVNMSFWWSWIMGEYDFYYWWLLIMGEYELEEGRGLGGGAHKQTDRQTQIHINTMAMA